VMITDLVRNDLGRVARSGSVNVAALCALETYETVHHLVSTVRAELKEDLHPLDCIRACFPGGSMTGAPKIRTMEILDNLESSARGVYSGALGYISNDGATDLSVVIRTLVLKGPTISIGTGGGIVASSDPEAEYKEAMLKAEAVIAAIREYYRDSGGR
jgi:para-aminobenzoate synthetase